MKQLVILGTLATTSLLAGAAHAQPSQTLVAQPAPDGGAAAAEDSVPHIYVGGGVELGGNLNIMGGVYGEGGIEVVRNMFLHARYAHGDGSDLSEALGGSTDGAFVHGDMHYDQFRAGLELNACTSSGVACFIYGADLGLLRSSASTGPTTATPSATYLEESIVPRIGIDVGGTHVRARLAVEVPIGQSQRRSDDAMDNADRFGVQGKMLSAGVAYKF